MHYSAALLLQVVHAVGATAPTLSTLLTTTQGTSVKPIIHFVKTNIAVKVAAAGSAPLQKQAISIRTWIYGASAVPLNSDY